MKKGTVITISRQSGSGGHEIGRKLSAKLGIPFYDKELLRLAAEKSGIAPENFEFYDEVPTSSLLYSLSLGNFGMAMGQYDIPIHQKIFLAQFDTIRDLAAKGESCIILGRCADYALAKQEQVIKVFLQGSPEARAKRISELKDVTPKKAAEVMVKTDKRRASYHNFYADTRWGSPESYDIMLDTLTLGMDNAVEVLYTYANLRFPD